MDYNNKLQDMKDEYNQRLGKKQQLETDVKSKIDERERNKARLLDVESERVILQKTSDKARESAKTRLESTMTTALQHVFGPNFSAEIEMKTSAGRPVAEIYVITDYGNGNIVRTKPEDSRGGGVVDIISIALRIAMIQLHNDPPINGPIILDEPGKHVSADYSVKLSEFLKFISQQFGKQIIFVTHNDDLKSIADKSYTVTMNDGESIVTESSSITGGIDNAEMPF